MERIRKCWWSWRVPFTNNSRPRYILCILLYMCMYMCMYVYVYACTRTCTYTIHMNMYTMYIHVTALTYWQLNIQMHQEPVWKWSKQKQAKKSLPLPPPPPPPLPLPLSLSLLTCINSILSILQLKRLRGETVEEGKPPRKKKDEDQ